MIPRRDNVGLWLRVGVLWVVLWGGADSLSCWRCGEYSDGVGSITPCLNTSKLRLTTCSRENDRYCIKYVNELSVVRDCVPTCSEKESWGAHTYCCNTDGCNSSPNVNNTTNLLWLLVVLLPALIAA